jgi:PAS domain S-box-containing protein
MDMRSTRTADPLAPPGGLSQIVFDSLRERICVLDGNGIILLTNQAWNSAARANRARQTACGPGANYLKVCWSAAGPFSEGAAEAAAGIESVLRGAAPHFTLDYACPPPGRRAWFRVTVRPLCQPGGGAIVSHSDITGQVLLAEKLRRTEAHYGALMESPLHAATVLAADATIQYQSPASEAVLGFQAEELVGHRIYEFVHPEDSATIGGVLSDCLRFPDRRHPTAYRFRNKDGSWRMLESIARVHLAYPMRAIVLNSRDITSQKLAEKALLEKQDALLRQRQDLEYLVTSLWSEQEEQRRQTSLELNHNLGRQLAILSLQAAQLASHPESAAVQLRHVQQSVAILREDLRDLADRLHPLVLDHLGLAVALREYCEQFSRREGIQVGFSHRRTSSQLAGNIVWALYRVAGEALANIARHANTKQAWVALCGTAKGIRLSVRDGGVGFEPAQLEPGSGLGILRMRERLRAVEGSLSICSRHGGGTEIEAIVPLLPAGNEPGAAIPRDVVVDPLDQD